MFTADCKLYHPKKELETIRITGGSPSGSRDTMKKNSSEAFYRPLGLYNVFASNQNKAKTVVLLKEPTLGKRIEEYFGQNRENSSLKKAIDACAQSYLFSRVFHPFSK